MTAISNRGKITRTFLKTAFAEEKKKRKCASKAIQLFCTFLANVLANDDRMTPHKNAPCYCLVRVQATGHMFLLGCNANATYTSDCPRAPGMQNTFLPKHWTCHFVALIPKPKK